MTSAKATEFMHGKIYWAKILGTPRTNYDGDAREWTFEFEPDENGLALLKKHGLTDRLKNKYEDRGAYLVLRKSELNKEGEKNPHIRVYNSEDQAWDHSVLIGNGSSGDVKLDIRDYGRGKKKGIYPVALRVTDLVPYQSTEFGKYDEGSDKPAKKASAPKKDTFREDFGLDDPID